MTIGQDRFSNRMQKRVVSTWIPIIRSWRAQYQLLNNFFGDIEPPSIYNEWTNVGLLSSAIHNAYGKRAMTLIERPVSRNLDMVEGRLDLWFDINLPRYNETRMDYRLEAKQLSVARLSPEIAARKIILSAIPDFNRAFLTGKNGWTLRVASATFLVLELSESKIGTNIKSKLNSLEEQLWLKLLSNLERVMPAKRNRHLIMSSIGHPSCEYMPYKAKKTIAVFLVVFGCREYFQFG